MAGRLAGKSAVVTGGTRGIGYAIAAAFLAEGANVFVSGGTVDSVEAALQRLDAGGSCAGAAHDLTTAEAPARLIDDAVGELGGIDILVNNAGVVTPADEWQLTPAEWDRVMAVNTRAAFFATQAAARIMRDGDGGSVLNVASIAGQTGGIGGSPAYATAKAAIIGLTRSLARRLAAHAIRVNAISPADIETDMTAGWPDELRQRLIAITPLARFGDADEVAGAAVFLASDEASFITGQTININGGAFMS